MISSELAAVATGRPMELFVADMARYQKALEEAITGRRILVIGGAGSIGSATVRTLVRFSPGLLCVVDRDENGLVDLLRDLRARETGLSRTELAFLPIDFGSPVMARFLAEQPPFDVVLNFAAVKHVRSEKDSYSLLHMLHTNVLANLDLLTWLAQRGGTSRFFCVSTDKAASPTSAMGASKQLMEQVVMHARELVGFEGGVTSARFANVAFSNGSLLASWPRRIELRQPLAVPESTTRFFLSHNEAGALCTLAGTVAQPPSLLVPRLDPAKNLVVLSEVCVRYLASRGFEATFYRNEELAKVAAASQSGVQWPVFLSARDTDGEKGFEEFLGAHERPVELGFTDLLGVPHAGTVPPRLRESLATFRRWFDSPGERATKSQLLEALASVVEGFEHVQTGKTLDSRL